MASMHQPKKSETIEVRLSHDAKSAFMARCRAQNRTASDSIRLFIDSQIEQDRVVRPRRIPHRRLIAAAALGALLGAGAAAPSLAHATQTSRASFDRLDRNHDGVVTFEEFRSR